MWVSFRLCDQWYCQRLEAVEQILVHQTVVPVPGGPEEVEGVINVRGDIVPVLDLHRLLSMTRLSATQELRVVLVRYAEGALAGFVVDSVSDVFELNEMELQHCSDDELILGTYLRQGELYTVLDLEKVAKSIH